MNAGLTSTDARMHTYTHTRRKGKFVPLLN
jgi:hypothetical protein